jgi:hypothetical protein
MKLTEILNSYQIESLEQLATDKIQDLNHIRLPKEVLVEELSYYLMKYPNIEKSVSLRNPPSFLILSRIMDAQDHKVPIQGFKEIVKKETANFVERATKGEGLRPKRDYSLYLKMLQIAWESDSSIDASEAKLLMGLREELDISFPEHIILEHHESLTPYWYNDNYFEKERNHLIASGIIFPLEGNFLIPDELVILIRKAWGYSLTTEQYKRLLSYMSGHDLTEIQKKNEIQTSGTLEEKIERISNNHISPKNALNIVGIETLRELARNIGAQISGSKTEVIDNIIDLMDSDEDIKYMAEQEKKIAPPPVEPKILSKDVFRRVFGELSNEQIYSIAVGLRRVRKSGNKEKRVDNLYDCTYSENSLLNQLSSADLYDLCVKLELKVAGSKQEKIERILSNFSSFKNDPESNVHDVSPEELIRQSMRVEQKKQVTESTEGIDKLIIKYPFLSREELIILSFILENKNASGPIIERLIARFDLPWYFPDKQMIEMIDKLKKQGHDIISITHYGDYPLYQLKIAE